MPTYDYQCQTCDHRFSAVLPMSKSTEIPLCDSCGAPNVKKLVSSSPNVIFAGDDWATKNNRIRGQMAHKNKILDAKQAVLKREAPPVKLVPNVKGERFDSWSEAKKYAGSEGCNTSSFDSYVRKEVESKK